MSFFNACLPWKPYIGKRREGVTATLKMLVDPLCDREIDHASCLTGQAFAFVAPVTEPLRLFTPVKTPFSALVDGLDVLGFTPRLIQHTWPADAESQREFWNAISGLLGSGPVAIGPIDRAEIWNRFEDRIHLGGGSFLILLALQEERLFAHDPGGCPYLQLSLERLTRALSGRAEWREMVGWTGAACITAGRAVISSPRHRYRQCWNYAGRLVDATRMRPDYGANGIMTLVEVIGSGKLRGSLAAGLAFGLSDFALAINDLGCFVQDSVAMQQAAPHLVQQSEALKRLISCQTNNVIGAMLALQNSEQTRLIRTLQAIAACQWHFDELLLQGHHRNADPGT